MRVIVNDKYVSVKKMTVKPGKGPAPVDKAPLPGQEAAVPNTQAPPERPNTVDATHRFGKRPGNR